MMDFEDALDGNAAAGSLAQVFALDVTVASIRCDGCGHEGPVAELRLYDGGPGKTMRCGSCGIENLRICERPGQVVLDLRGATRLVFDVPRDRG